MRTTFGQPGPEDSGGTALRAPGQTRPQAPRKTPARESPALARGSSEMNDDRSLVEALNNSVVFQDYARAFTEATGLPVALRAVESWQLPHHGQRNESPFCAVVLETSRACASCLSVQEQLSAAAAQQAHTLTCPAGLSETAVPVRLGDRLIGFLQTGQVFRKPPGRAQFQRIQRLLAAWGVRASPRKIEQAYFSTRVVPGKQHDAVVKLLTIFAQHLSLLSNQVVLQQSNAEPLVISRAKKYIQEHQTENLRLGHVAKAVNTSTFYFCKIFKKATGLNFTDYLSRVRIEKSKNLLLNPNLRVSEIAFEVGFQSLTHFNRVFKKILGQSPTEYRAQLLGKG
ncbi:MAG TPA: helix-turn-helix domain-containing protein [Verrucomicrobiota bacterium]|nr:helix-turn-helix domain-containing protein [Verrucomicrobiota bacterium]HNW06518.1 helix-turn-helix domain-containing protein [Verrucomicrobiota bacterium]HNZ74805.1 helix-turn-helix domain-containing protein [Verrucomicrobiota bacterium]HOH38939.1 helix-turn-helix domain-containing protein [Verrucomicrobiota bacterium]HOX61653.1 helix-turn-helix domain-containing protein [Verrucomicrobiota bacterium]